MQAREDALARHEAQLAAQAAADQDDGFTPEGGFPRVDTRFDAVQREYDRVLREQREELGALRRESVGMREQLEKQEILIFTITK